MTDLDDLVRRHYSRQRMEPARMAAMLRPAPPRPSKRRLALGLALATAAGWLGAMWLGGLHLLDRDADRVVAEIALNHRKQLAMDVASPDYETLGARMAQLEFPLRRPGELSATAALVGARYCSIDGGLAVQLRLRDPVVRGAQTLFATRATQSLRAMKRGQAFSEGVAVRYWMEGDVFYAHAVDGVPIDRP